MGKGVRSEGAQPDLPPLPEATIVSPMTTPELPAEAPATPQIESPDATYIPPPAETKIEPPKAPTNQIAAVPSAPTQTRSARSEPPKKMEPANRPVAREEFKHRRSDQRKPLNPTDKAARRASAPPTATARQSETAVAPSASASLNPAAALATWKGSLLALLNRNKRYPANAAADGTANIAFTIDRAGAVTSARLVNSSGDRRLDEEAVALPRRCSPVPAPPADLGRGPITLTVPIRFNREAL